uniref:Uncharacterized protein n=1 Tax=Triticum urartu TaxID=4572 RepID=A0A8R7R6J8_TRIUA
MLYDKTLPYHILSNSDYDNHKLNKKLSDLFSRLYFVPLYVFPSYLTHYHILALSDCQYQGQEFSIHFLEHQTILAQWYHSHPKNLRMILQCKKNLKMHQHT